MNIALWILQVLLALHTGIGAAWKFSHSAAETMPSFGAISPGIWTALAVMELICALLLVLPAVHKPLMKFVPRAALVIAVEMLGFCGIHLASGAGDFGPLVYWLVVAALCAFIAFGRLRKA